MSTDRDTTRIVRSWLRTDEHESADRVLDAVLDQLDTTPQRRAFLPAWRLPKMNNTAKLALGAAVVVVVALVGIRFLVPGQGVGGPIDGASPVPTVAPQPLPGSGTLEPGTYLVSRSDWTPRPFTITVPPGWRTAEGFVSKGDGDGLAPDAAGDVFVVSWIVSHVYADACQHAGTMDEAMVEARTPAEIVDALARQGGHETTGPTAATLGGYPAQRLEFHVPADFDVRSCDGDLLRLWPDSGPDTSGGLPIAVGQTMTVYVVDIDGECVVVAAASIADASAADVAETERVTTSIRFLPEQAP